MRWREFIGGLAGAAAMPAGHACAAARQNAARRLGFVKGENVAIGLREGLS
jgi:hypothetical protein